MKFLAERERNTLFLPQNRVLTSRLITHENHTYEAKPLLL